MREGLALRWPLACLYFCLLAFRGTAFPLSSRRRANQRRDRGQGWLVDMMGGYEGESVGRGWGNLAPLDCGMWWISSPFAPTRARGRSNSRFNQVVWQACKNKDSKRSSKGRRVFVSATLHARSFFSSSSHYMRPNQAQTARLKGDKGGAVSSV